MAAPEFTTEELETEEWRPIPGYQTRYEVSSLGRIKRVNRTTEPRERMMSTRSAKSYCRVNLYDRNDVPKHRVLLVHKLVAQAFLGQCPVDFEVNHKDLDKSNPRLENLEYVTRTENMRHAAHNGRMKWAEGRAQPKRKIVRGCRLTISRVIAIRRGILDGIPNHALASRYGVTPNHISIIKNGRSWGHVTELRDEVAAFRPWQTAIRALRNGI